MSKGINSVFDSKRILDEHETGPAAIIEKLPPNQNKTSATSIPNISDFDVFHPCQMNQNPTDIDLVQSININNIPGLQDGGMKDNKQLHNVHQVLESCLSDNSRQKISNIVTEVSSLTAQEKLLLYLRLPAGNRECDPLRQQQNPLGTRREINDTITWIRSHLKHDAKVSIPKQDVYNDYTAYCDRMDIKPLSTADFGKVMKQVFPEIKPRRLGTRGHSRYCYAAMRKTTKLSPPHLPKMKSEFNTPYIGGETNNDAWQTIKTWAEKNFHTSFESPSDLASYITSHSLNTQLKNSTDAIFLKKNLQRENKTKKKFSEIVASKKRRKRKTISLYSEQTEKLTPTSMLQNNDSLNTKQSAFYESDQDVKLEKAKLFDSDILPMNLTSDDKTFINATVCEKAIVEKSALILPESVIDPNADIKEEFTDEQNSNIFCKKVRQAQQAKGIWVPEQYIANNNYAMGPPASHILYPYNTSTTDPTGGKKLTNMDTTETHLLAAHKNRMQASAKKIKGLQNKTENNQYPESIEDEKDVLPGNLGLPRERVISICNMDKHELDDYLIGENSQEQEAELLQYFQPQESGVKNINEYNLNDKNKTSSGDATEITQLRQYLHQNLQHNRNLDIHNNQKSCVQQPNMGSASASLANLSQRHGIMRSDNNCFNMERQHGIRNKKIMNAMYYGPIRKNPNTNFVPISLRNMDSNDCGQFASPKSKVNIQKPSVNWRKSTKDAFDYNLSDPMIGANQSIVNVLSSSAPTSPSALQHSNQYVPNLIPIGVVPENAYMNNNNNNNNNAPESHFNEIAEFRSRSVPLHCRSSPICSTNDCYGGGIITAGNSVNPTPIPTEFNDFTEPLLGFYSENNITEPNHFEGGSLLDIDIPFVNTTNEIRNKNPCLNYIEKSDSIHFTSRSNPSTPLLNRIDANCGLKLIDNSLMYDVSKSVPTTPNCLVNTNFRYSPNTNRDCSMNPNTLGANSEFYHRNHMKSLYMAESRTIGLPNANPSPDEDGILNNSSKTIA